MSILVNKKNIFVSILIFFLSFILVGCSTSIQPKVNKQEALSKLKNPTKVFVSKTDDPVIQCNKKYCAIIDFSGFANSNITANILDIQNKKIVTKIKYQDNENKYRKTLLKYGLNTGFMGDKYKIVNNFYIEAGKDLSSYIIRNLDNNKIYKLKLPKKYTNILSVIELNKNNLLLITEYFEINMLSTNKNIIMLVKYNVKEKKFENLYIKKLKSVKKNLVTALFGTVSGSNNSSWRHHSNIVVFNKLEKIYLGITSQLLTSSRAGWFNSAIESSLSVIDYNGNEIDNLYNSSKDKFINYGYISKFNDNIAIISPVSKYVMKKKSIPVKSYIMNPRTAKVKEFPYSNNVVSVANDKILYKFGREIYLVDF